MKLGKLFLILLVALTSGTLLAAAASWTFGTTESASADATSATWEVGTGCTEVTNSLTRANYGYDGLTDNTCATPSGATMPGFPASGIPPSPTPDNQFMYFNVDSSYMSGSTYPFARVDVQYFDGAYASDGATYFVIDYQSSSSAYSTSPQKAYLNNTQTYLTASFYLSDVNFNNGEHGIADFRVDLHDPGASPLYVRKVTVTRLDAAAFGNASNVSYLASDPPVGSQGINLENVGSDHTITATVSGRTATQVSANGYAYFDVDNGYMYNGNYPYASIEVSYYDQGYGRFYIQYDSSSTLASDPTAALSFDPDLQSNNVAYLTNSLTWKTYTFYLSNVKFANSQLLGVADFKLVYAIGSDATVANQGYLLAFDRVTVTRSSTALDRTAPLQGNYSGFGDPVVVWTRLAQANEGGHGLYQDDSVADGGTTASQQGNEWSRLNSPGGYIYFDVNDTYINNGNAGDVWVTVEYFDNGTNPFWIEYDSSSSTNTKSESVARAGSNTWKRYTFYLTDAYFGNRQSGGNDFRITSQAKDLYVKQVYVERSPGNLVNPRGSGSPAIGGQAGASRMVVTHYFPIFDSYYPSLWPASTITPTGTLVNGYPEDYSYRSIASIKRDLEDMKAANIDAITVWYQGNTNDASWGGVQAIRNLVAAAQQVTNPPKIGLLLDGLHIQTESVLKDANALPDGTTTLGKSLYFKLAEDFYSMVPSNLWATVNGEPLIALYAPPQDANQAPAKYDASTVQFLYDNFDRAFSVRPYIVADIEWDPTGAKGITPDQFFAWGAPLYSTGYSPFWSSTASVGPGFSEASPQYPGMALRSRSREGGAFYASSWAPIIAKGPQIVFVETWNYWPEGSGIADSVQYGRQYITSTAQFVQSFKSTTYGGTTTASVTLASTNTNSGLYQDELGNGATTVVNVGGRTGRKSVADNMFFSVNDSFLYKADYGSTVDITVTYFDADSAHGGTDWFAIEYDGAGGAYYPSSVTQDTLVDIKNYGNTLTWKTKTFHFTDVYFGNREDNRDDFVLKDPTSGGLTVQQVTITKPAVLNLPVRAFLPLTSKVSTGW